MKDVTDKNFGVLIAFCLPGFLLLWGLSFSSPLVAAWLVQTSKSDGPTVGGFLYATLASLALGLLISAVRWLVVDHILAWFYYFCGKPLPKINFAKLKDEHKLAAFQGVVDNHYRYYQYYSNTLVAVIAGFVVYLKYTQQWPSCLIWTAVVGLSLTLLLASGDCLRKYHDRAAAITV